MKRGPARRPRRPASGGRGLPNWVLLVLVIGALGGSTALFLDGRDDSSSKRKSDDRTVTDGDVLELPKTGTNGDSDTRRRGETGRSRLDQHTGANEDDHTSTDGSDSTGTAAATLAEATSLQDVHIALTAADAGPPAGSTAKVAMTVGGLRTTCATTAAHASSLVVERRLLGLIAAELRRRGATVDRIDGTDQRAPCAAKRVARLEAANAGVVLSVGARASASVVTSGLVAKGAAATDTARATALVQRISAATAIPTAPTPLTAALRAPLLAAGVIDLAKGGATIWLALPPETPADPTATTALVAAIGQAFAAELGPKPAQDTTSTTSTTPPAD